MKWVRHKSLNEDDMSRLQGTELFSALANNRLVIILDDQEKLPNWSEVGLYDCADVYYVSTINKSVTEIYFANQLDLIKLEEQLAQYKLGQS